MIALSLGTSNVVLDDPVASNRADYDWASRQHSSDRLAFIRNLLSYHAPLSTVPLLLPLDVQKGELRGRIDRRTTLETSRAYSKNREAVL